MPRIVAAVAALVVLLAAAFAVASRAEAGQAAPSPASSIDVVGSGTIVWNQVAVRAEPNEASPRIAVLTEFRPGFHPRYVLALDVVRDEAGEPAWYRISIPGRPNGKTGWVRAAALDLQPVQKRLIVYRGARRFEFWDGKTLVRSGKVAVGKPGAETPLGLFYVMSRFKPTAEILGAYAFETSAYSKLTDWPGGGVVGVHGTYWPWLLGRNVSHGCVRLHNRDILFLRSRVPLGMPIKIVR